MTETASSDSPADTLRERASSNRVKLWLLMAANRRLLTAFILLFLFVALVALDTFNFTSFQAALAKSDPVETLFQGLVGAIITGVTLVVTLSQLVLSQELGAVGDQQERMEEAMSFRRNVEDQTKVVISPPEPAAFLRGLAEAAGDRAEALAKAVGSDRTDTAAQETRTLTESIANNARKVTEQFEGAQFGTFEVVSASLNFNYSWKIYQARRLKNEHEDSFSQEVLSAFDELIEVMTLFGPAREHFKTLYFEWELIDLSRGMVYLAVPALFVSIGSLMYLGTPNLIQGVFLGIANVTWIVSAAVTVSVSPFVLLLSYILRIVTVAKLTLAMGPFILQETNRSKSIDEKRDA